MSAVEEVEPEQADVSVPVQSFAGAWRRLGGWVIDYVIVNVLALVPAALLVSATHLPKDLTGGLVVLGIWPVYSILFVHLGGRTIGRIAVGIRVVDLADGRPPGWGRSTIRTLVQLSLILLLFVPILAALNYARVLWDPRKQSWHDRAARTIVVRTRGVAARPIAAGASEPPVALPPAPGWAPPLPLPPSRWRRAGIVGLTIVGSGLLGLFSYVGVYRYLEQDLVSTDFETSAEPFEVGGNEFGTYDLVDGTYRITVEQEGDWAGSLGDLRRKAYALGVQADLVDVTQPGIEVGVGCAGPAPGSEGLDGYVLVVAPGGDFSLYRDDLVREGSDPRIQSVRRLSIMCVPGSDGSVFVLGFANGSEVVRYHDPSGPAAYTYALLVATGEPGSQVRFTNVWARVPDERWTTDAPPEASNEDDGGAGSGGAAPAGAVDDGVGTAPSETFAAHGVSFDPPTGWAVGRDRTPHAKGWEAEWIVTARPPDARFLEGVRVIALSTGGVQAGEVAMGRLDFYARRRGTVEGPTATTVAGLPAFQGSVLGYTRYGRDLERRVVVVVDGATAFEISCQYERHDAEMANGCDRIIDTFELAG